ncbi:MAG TPA: hypothetical protein VM221_09320 [Armatimonadota bacterium]|nr:hypothetical protein [Armatimonadota bacterium]
MKVALREIFEAREALERLLAAPLEFRLAYRMHRLARRLMDELREIEAVRIRLVEQYADEQTDAERQAGAPLQVRARIADFRRDFEALLREEVEIDAEPIPFECLETLTVSVVDLVRLTPFVGEVAGV